MDPDHPALLVILGAGASFDSARRTYSYDEVTDARRPELLLPPPLAVDLVSPQFDDISLKLPASQAIIDNLRRRIAVEGGATSLETELARLANDGSPERRAGMMAFRLYLQRVIGRAAGEWHAAHYGYTRYLTLFDQIGDWRRETQARVDVVTFNYDVLAEEALSRVVPDWRLGSDLGSYVRRQDFRLFKLHGSIGWSRVFSLVELATKLEPPDLALSYQRTRGLDILPLATMLAAQGLSISGQPIEPVWPSELSGRDSLNLPALAVPVEGKMDFECPLDHVDRLERQLPDVTHVLIIGWRGAERHAIGLLDGERSDHGGLSNGYALGIVSDSVEHASETRMNLGSVGDKGRQNLIVTSGFGGFIEDEIAQLTNFLESQT